MKRVLRNRLKRRVLVSTKSGDAFRGIWFDGDNQAIVLRDAEHIQPATERQFVPADGEIVILVAEIAYMQFI
jgi:small nuclear ribonucleoprotein (snRNP)-like protein